MGLYAINRAGDVFSKKRDGSWRMLKPYLIAGYKAIGFCIEGKRKITHIHRLLAITYIPNPHNKPCVNHKDGNKLNNDLSNLEWNSHSENSKHAFKIGLSTHRGENCHTAKLKSNTAKAIYLLKDQYSQSDLAKMFGVKQNVIYKIHKKISWKHETANLD